MRERIKISTIPSRMQGQGWPGENRACTRHLHVHRIFETAAECGLINLSPYAPVSTSMTHADFRRF